MKKLFLASILQFLYLFISAQCTVCNIDLTCDATPKYPTSCPDFLPSDTVNTPYEASFTFYLPETFEAQGFNVDFKKLEVLGVSGLPAGLTWDVFDHNGNSSTVFFPNSNPPLTERICAKICGTPIVPGAYQAVVTARITVDAGIAGEQIVTESFVYDFTIFPSASSNNAFSASADFGCGSLEVDLMPNIPSNGSDLIDYSWDFGNGFNSFSEIPPTQTYSPGAYTVSLETNIYKYVIDDISISTITSEIWCGEVSEDQFCNGIFAANPDYYIFISSNGLQTEVPKQNTTLNPTWANLEIPLDDSVFTAQFWEGDGVLNPDDSLGTLSIIINGEGTYSVLLPSFESTNNLLEATFTVTKSISQVVSDSQVVMVYENPNPGTIVSSNASPCEGDTTILSLDTLYDGYQWYNDTNLLTTVIDQPTIEVIDQADYSVLVTNQNGCSGFSSVFTYQTNSNPNFPQPSISLDSGLVLYVNNDPNLSYQWYKNNTVMVGENTSSLLVIDTGTYLLEVINSEGCSTFSNPLLIDNIPPPVSINEHYTSVFNFYPNPNNIGMLTVDFTENTFNQSLIIEDVLGKKVQQVLIDSKTKNIDISTLPKGLYFISITQNQYKERLIVN